MEFAFAADPCMTSESPSSPGLCFALPRVQSGASSACLPALVLPRFTGGAAAKFPNVACVFQFIFLLNPHSVLRKLPLALLKRSVEGAFKGRCESGAEILCFGFGLQSCSWNSKHEISLETFFVCLSEEIAGRREDLSVEL